MKASLVDLVASKAAQSTGGGGRELEQRRSELAPLKMSALRQQARASGAKREQLDAVEDAEDPKAEVISLLLSLRNLAPGLSDTEREKLRAELVPLKMSALKARAQASGVGQDALDAVYDSDDPRESIIELLLAVHGDESAAGEAAAAKAAAVAQAAAAQLRAELQGMRASALRRRAEAVGVSADELDDADDSDDPRAAAVGLILAAAAAAYVADAVIAKATEEPAARVDNIVAAAAKAREELSAELSSMKLSALRKRAIRMGVDDEALDQADDSHDVKSALVELVLALPAESVLEPDSKQTRPHYGSSAQTMPVPAGTPVVVAASPAGGGGVARQQQLLGGKHVMLSCKC